jgi:PAS domain S-box-containing protein
MKKSAKITREEEALRDFFRVLNVLRESNQALIEASEEVPFLREMCRVLVETAGYSLAWVGYREEGSSRLMPVAVVGDVDGFLQAATFTLDDSELGQAPPSVAFRRGVPVYAPNLETDPTFEPWREAARQAGLASCLALPLIDKGQTFGVLSIFAEPPDAFPPAEQSMLANLAKATAFGVMVLRTQAERENLKNDLKLKATMLDFASESVFIQDLEGRFLWFNRATARELGYTEEELLTLNSFQLETPEYARLQNERLKELLERGETTFESAHFRKDSTVLPVEIHARVVELGGKKVILIASRNLSERWQSKQTHKELEEKYRRLYDSSQVGVFRARLSDLRFLECNQRLAQMLGYDSREEFLQDYIPSEHFVDASTRERLLASLRNGDLRNFEIRFYRRDGAIVSLLLSGTVDHSLGLFEGVASDISDLRKVEEELRQSEDKYRTLVEQQLGRSLLYAMERHRLKQEMHRDRELCAKVIDGCGDGILAFDRNYRLTLWSGAMEELTGLSRSKVINKNVFKVLPIFKELQESRQVFSTTPQPHFLDTERPLQLSLTGPEGFFDASFTPLLNESGEVAGGLITIRNLTEAKRVEQALRDKQRLLANLFSGLQSGISILDPTYTILQVNPVLSQWYSHAQPLVGRKCYEAYHGREAPCEFCPTKQTLETGRPGKALVPRRGPHGEEVGWLEVHTYPLTDLETGARLGVIEHSVDVSEQRRMEAELREFQGRYQFMVSSLPVLVVRLQPDWSVACFDDQIEAFTGYSREQFANRSLHWLDLVAEEDRETVARLFSQPPGLEQPKAREYRLKQKDGGTLWVQENAQVIYRPDGSLSHAELVVVDISERKKTEEMRPKLEDQLRQAQRLEAIGTLAGGIAHDFNNILGVMLGYTEMTLAALPDDSPLKRKLLQVLKAGQRGKELVSQILAFSRPMKQERRPTQVGAIIKETLKMLRATLPTTIELKMSLENRQDTVLADPTQIHQVLINLCANAAHAMREQGGVLEVKLRPVNLDTESARQYHDLKPGAYVQLSISDTGHGMDKTVLERIFDPFFTTKAPGEGTGMGLAVVHGIIKSHHGAIVVDSEPGKGSTFHVLLPRIEEREVSGSRENASMDRGQGRILFVDDEEWLVEMWQEILQSLGFDVHTTMSSTEALELFNKQPEYYDLVITDQTMARMTGFELAKAMLAIRPDIPIILCTGYSDLITPEKAKEAGIREFAMKPLSISDLTAAIQRILPGKSQAVSRD